MNNKLRYYLRGLGLGIVVTAVILAVAYGNSKKELTDAEIKAKAAQLGMVDPATLSLTDAVNEGKPGGNVDTDVTVAKDSDETDADGSVETETGDGAGETDAEEPVVDTTVPDDTEVVEPEEIPEPSDTGDTVTITIPSGAGSETVAARIRDAGLVDDAADFDNYMEKNGYSRYISVGTFTIPKGSSYEEICKIISSK